MYKHRLWTGEIKFITLTLGNFLENQYKKAFT